MATNLCAECGTRLPRPEYKTHMQQVHGMQVMDDSDDETTEAVRQQQVVADEAPRPQRQRRSRYPALASNRADTEANGAVDGAAAAGAEATEPSQAPKGGSRTEGRRRRRSGRSRRTARSASGEADEQGGKMAPGSPFPCTECDRAFASAQGLMRHTSAKHPGTAAAEAAAAAAAATNQPPVRRGGRPQRAAAAPAAESATDSVVNTAAAPRPEGAAVQQPALIPVPIGNRAPYTINDGSVMSSDRRRPRPRRSRGASRGAAPPAAPPSASPEAPAGPDTAEAAAYAAAAAALGGAPASAPAGSSSVAGPRPARLVTLFRCKICEQGFKSKNRARAHVAEVHPDALPSAPAEGSFTGQEGGEVPADGQLELVQVAARRGPRSQGRQGRKPTAAASDAAADSNSDPNANSGGNTNPTQSRPSARRRGRPRRRNAATDSTGAADAATRGGGTDTAVVTAAAPSGGANGGRGDGRLPADLAALGIVATS